MTRPSRTFADYVRIQDLKAGIARDMGALVAMDAGAARELVEEFVDVLGMSKAIGSPSKSTGPTIYGKVELAFLANNNTPLTKNELAKAAGISDSSIHTILYASHPDHFDRKPNPSGGRERVFSLKPAVFEEAKESPPHE